jgi:hypothetical protein
MGRASQKIDSQAQALRQPSKTNKTNSQGTHHNTRSQSLCPSHYERRTSVKQNCTTPIHRPFSRYPCAHTHTHTHTHTHNTRSCESVQHTEGEKDRQGQRGERTITSSSGDTVTAVRITSPTVVPLLFCRPCRNFLNSFHITSRDPLYISLHLPTNTPRSCTAGVWNALLPESLKCSRPTFWL